jgi:hypothetical protein
VGAVGDGTGGKVVIRSTKGGAAVTAPADGTTIMNLRATNSNIIRLVRTGATVRIFAGAPNSVEMDSTSSAAAWPTSAS